MPVGLGAGRSRQKWHVAGLAVWSFGGGGREMTCGAVRAV
jgi:hypothetical protein